MAATPSARSWAHLSAHVWTRRGRTSGCRVHREKLCVIASIQDSASDGDIDPKKKGKKGPLESPSEKDGCESALHRVVCDCMCDCLQDCPSDSDVPPKKKGKKGPSDSASEDVCESALHRVVCCDCVIVCRIAKATATSTRRRRRRRAHWTCHRTRMSCNLYMQVHSCHVIQNLKQTPSRPGRICPATSTALRTPPLPIPFWTQRPANQLVCQCHRRFGIYS